MSDRERLGIPRYTIRQFAPATGRGGCPSYDVWDRQARDIVFGPTADYLATTRACDRLSRADAAPVVTPPRQMGMEGVAS